MNLSTVLTASLILYHRTQLLLIYWSIRCFCGTCSVLYGCISCLTGISRHWQYLSWRIILVVRSNISLIPRLSQNANLYHEEFHTCATSMFAFRSVRAWEQGWSNMQEVGVGWEKHAGGFEVLVIKFLSRFPRMSLALVPRLPPKYSTASSDYLLASTLDPS